MDFFNYLDVKGWRPFIEIMTVFEDLRKLGRVENSSAEELEISKKVAENLGLKTKVFKQKVSGLEKELFFLLVSKKADILESAEEFHFGDENNDVNMKLGNLYGYPECCIRHFNENIDLMIQEKDLELKLKTIKKDGSGKYSFLMNNFNKSGFVFHHTCSYSCKETFRRADQVKKMIFNFDKNLFKHLKDKNRVAIIANEERCIFLKNFTLEKDGVTINYDEVGGKAPSFGRLLEKKESISFEDSSLNAFVFI